MAGTIYIKDLRLHAYHGVMEQERTVGNDYVINIAVDYPIDNAGTTDDVRDTLNYAELADIIKAEMSVPSNLIEHVAQRIVATIRARYPEAGTIDLDIMKAAPPFSADCLGAGVRIRD